MRRQLDASQNEVSRTDYVYDKVGRLSALWAGQGEMVSFVYDAGGRLTEQWLPTGVNTRHSYNADNTLQLVEHRSASGTQFGEHEYTYNTVGQRATAEHRDLTCATTTTETYTYDTLNRLTSVSTLEVENAQTTVDETESYTYDALNNRRTVNGNTDHYLYNAANQLTSIRLGSSSGSVLNDFTYDPNGNLVSKTSTEGNLTLIYDAWDQLTQANKTWAHPESYGYDDLGRRVRKTAGSTTQDYLYDGLAIAAEFTGGNWTTATGRYVHGPGVDAPLIRVSQGTPTYYHQDGLGSVVAMTDGTGDATGTARYTAWGEVARRTGGIPQYGYTGREPDATGLIYYRSRYYDPHVGRFTQTDSIALAGGLNQYAYAGGNPTNFTDPLGTVPFSAAETSNGVPASPALLPAVEATESYFSNSAISSGPGQLFEVTRNPLTGRINRRPVLNVTTPFLSINGILNDLDAAVQNGLNNVREFFPGTSTFNLLHNPSEGFVRDISETFADKLGLTTDIAKQTAGVLQSAQASGQSLTVVPHSQGGAITASAVDFVNSTGGGALSNISIACFACANNNAVSGATYAQAGITNVQTRASSIDAVPNIIGLNGNPLEIVGSLLAAPLLLGPPSVSPHTLP